MVVVLDAVADAAVVVVVVVADADEEQSLEDTTLSVAVPVPLNVMPVLVYVPPLAAMLIQLGSVYCVEEPLTASMFQLLAIVVYQKIIFQINSTALFFLPQMEAQR